MSLLLFLVGVMPVEEERGATVVVVVAVATVVVVSGVADVVVVVATVEVVEATVVELEEAVAVDVVEVDEDVTVVELEAVVEDRGVDVVLSWGSVWLLFEAVSYPLSSFTSSGPRGRSPS